MKTIGRYEIVGRLGRGGMSTVYKARAPITGRLVALKILQPRDTLFAELLGEEKLKASFIAEAKIMGGLSHDHVAKVLDCAEHEGRPFIVLEYFAHSLGAFIGESYRVEDPSRKISAAKTQTYLIQALKGLERLHFAGIIHRDIKPYNLMLTSDDRVKIIDFGLSRVRGEEQTAVVGLQVGTPFYAAPEQVGDPLKADGRADLFSLGVMALRMLTGCLFPNGQEEAAIAEFIAPELGVPWEKWLRRSIARQPEDRFQTAQEMRLALQALPLTPKPVSAARENLVPWNSGSIRCRPAQVRLKHIRTDLGLDTLFRPLAYDLQDFTVVGPQVAFLRNSGLFWQRHGSGFTLNWQEAWEYVAHLNSTSCQGRDNWRLPTVAELRTVLKPPLHEVDCSSWPLFEGGVHWLWSGDTCNKKQAWTVDVVESFFERLDRDGVASVCGVSSA